MGACQRKARVVARQSPTTLHITTPVVFFDIRLYHIIIALVIFWQWFLPKADGVSRGSSQIGSRCGTNFPMDFESGVTYESDVGQMKNSVHNKAVNRWVPWKMHTHTQPYIIYIYTHLLYAYKHSKFITRQTPGCHTAPVQSNCAF